jgi:hypothetical protein
MTSQTKRGQHVGPAKAPRTIERKLGLARTDKDTMPCLDISYHEVVPSLLCRAHVRSCLCKAPGPNLTNKQDTE